MSIAGLFKLELVSNTVWVESTESMCGELDKKFMAKIGKEGRGEVWDRYGRVVSVELGEIRKWTSDGSNLAAHRGLKNDYSENEILLCVCCSIVCSYVPSVFGCLNKWDFADMGLCCMLLFCCKRCAMESAFL